MFGHLCSYTFYFTRTAEIWKLWSSCINSLNVFLNFHHTCRCFERNYWTESGRSVLNDSLQGAFWPKKTVAQGWIRRLQNCNVLSDITWPMMHKVSSIIVALSWKNIWAIHEIVCLISSKWQVQNFNDIWYSYHIDCEHQSNQMGKIYSVCK